MTTMYLSLFCVVAFLVSAHASEFTRASSFDSVAAFVAAAKAFRPAESKTDLARLFTVAEMGQPEDPKTGKPVAPESLDSCEAVWEGATHALVFAVATPKTEATPSSVGVLFLLSQSRHRWSISDLHRFTATGKYARALLVSLQRTSAPAINSAKRVCVRSSRLRRLRAVAAMATS